MTALTITDVGHLVRELNTSLQPPGKCAATPARVKQLLERLQDYTDEVQWARNKYRALGIASIAFGPAGIAASELLGGGDVDVAQWRHDMATWQFRLADYQRAMDNVPAEQMNTLEGCRSIYTTVTAPLLDGIWYQQMPGIAMSDADKATIRDGTRHCPPGVDVCEDIVYRDPVTGDHPPGHSSPKVPDVISPFTLGNQIVVYQDFQKENLRRLIQDIEDAVNPNKWPWWLKAVLISAAGIGVGLAGLYVYNLLPAPRRNPSRKAVGPRLRRGQKKRAEALLRRAAPYREYGETYNRGIDYSAQVLEESLSKKRESAVDTFSKELEARLEAA